MTDTSTTKLLIPAAGFGKRLGGKGAKELLCLKDEDLPILEHTLQLAKAYNFKSVVITRENKTDLNTYLDLKKREYDFEVCKIVSSIEWPDTLLQSEKYWGSKNIVILPDTRFMPLTILKQLSEGLNTFSIVFATFFQKDLSTWGSVRQESDQFYIAEKPSSFKEDDLAWGLFGFRKDIGLSLLQTILESKNQFSMLPSKHIQFYPLEYFEDKTRDGMQAFK
ncbi:MAG: 2-C-methyl-D-erythritol 4-phosphate cytidylyltransferase [Bdellovibrionales bacterium]|nr:2-C-methyl-D-erythritol 4-phosphate cytidylyltransferase [Bdellovibrionales bacterium]